MRIRSCGGRAVTSSPKKRTRPAVGGKSPVAALNSVVLPAPLAPISARRSPAPTESETSSIALSAPNVRVTPSSTRASPVASVSVTGVRLSRAGSPSRTVGHVARAETDLVEIGLAHAEALVDARHHLDHLVVEAAVGRLGNLGDERRADRLSVLVQRHLAGRRLELQVLQRLAVLRLATGQITIDRLEPIERRLHVDVVDVGEERGAWEAVLEVLLVVRHELLPLGRVVAVGDGTGRRRAEQRLAALALEVEHGLIDRDRAAHH